MAAILGIDTATEACTTGLWMDGEVRVRHAVTPRGHADRVLADCQALLAEAGLSLRDLDALAVGRGPGSFTGVRIGVGVAQGLAYAAGLRVIPVSTLAVIAQAVAEHAPARWIAVAIDARMEEVYWGVYRRDADGLVRPAGAERVCAPRAVSIPDEVGACVGAGSGWDTHGVALQARLQGRLREMEPGALPHAAALLRLAAAARERGEGVSPAEAHPVYLRDRVTHTGGSGG